MPSLRASSVRLSLSHVFDVQLRGFISDLWPTLPIAARQSWATHPEANDLGARMAFWKENYFRWRNKQGPVSQWPIPDWSAAATIDSVDCVAAGTSISATIRLYNFHNPCFLAVAFYGYRGRSIFGRGLRVLKYCQGQPTISFRLSAMRPRWQKGEVVIFTSSGAFYTSSQLPTVFCP